MNQQPNTTQDEQFAGAMPHIKDYLRIVLARKWIVVTAFIVVVVTAVIYALVQTPMYDATTQLLIEPVKMKVTKFEDVYDPTAGGVGGHMAMQEFYQTQYKLMVSRPVLESTFRRFNFSQKPEFAESRDPLSPFKQYFSVEPDRQSRLVDVTFQWREPELAARVVDYLVDEYIKEYRRRKMGVTLGGVQALRKKQEDLLPKVEAKGNELQEFMVKHNMVSLEKTQNIIVDRLKELNQTLGEVQSRKVEAASIVANIQQALDAGTSLDDLPEVAGNQAISSLKREFIRLKQELAGLSKRFGVNHPEVVATRTSLETVAEKLNEELHGIMASRQSELSRLESQQRTLEEQLAEQEQKVMRFNRLSIQYKNLKSDYERLNRTYKRISQRVEEIEISMAAGSKDENIFIINPATVPTSPSKPNKRMIVAGAGVFGLALGLGLCFFVDYLDTTIKTKQDVEEQLSTPVLGFIPGIRKGDLARAGDGSTPPIEFLALQKPRSAVAEAFRSIRTAMSFAGVDHQPGHLVVTSPSAGEGKSLTAVNMAFALANAGKRVVIIDADMRKARLHKVFGCEQSNGLSALLVSPNPEIEKALVQPVENLSNLSFIPSGPLPPNPAELLEGDHFQEVADKLAELYDVVIWDAPPTVNVTDAAILLNRLKNGILVVRGFCTQRNLAVRAVETLRASSGHLLGCVLNSVDVPNAGYYSYDSYYYYGGYEYYYGGSGNKKKRRRRRSENAKDGAASTVA